MHDASDAPRVSWQTTLVRTSVLHGNLLLLSIVLPVITSRHQPGSFHPSEYASESCRAYCEPPRLAAPSGTTAPPVYVSGGIIRPNVYGLQSWCFNSISFATAMSKSVSLLSECELVEMDSRSQATVPRPIAICADRSFASPSG